MLNAAHLVTLALASLPNGAEPTRDEVDFVRDVYPILQQRCFECHGAEKQKGDMRFDTRDGLFGDHDGFSAVVPGDPTDSLLLELALLPAEDPDAMPPKGDRLSADQLGVLRGWIEAGAPWTEVATAEAEPPALALEPLSAEQAAAREAALAALSADGYAVMPIARDLHAVDFNGSLAGERLDDGQLERLAPLAPSLVWLNLSGTAVTDAGLVHLAQLAQLRRLNLSRTAVTDAGLAQLGGLGALEVLNLYGTGVTDAGLAHLHGLASLTKLYLWETAVSDAGVAALAAARPGVMVNRGLVLPPPPINELCPVSGEAINPTLVQEFEGRSIAFHCVACQAAFDAHPAAFAKNLPAAEPAEGAEDAEAETKAVLNTICPVSGEAASPEVTSEFKGAPVAFCCAACKGKFDADPASFAEKVLALR